LIEINARPWDQHILGRASGADVIYAAYADHAGFRVPSCSTPFSRVRWVAEDALMLALLRSIWHRDASPVRILRLARGPRVHAIWDAADKRPFVVYMTTFLPSVLRRGIAASGRWLLHRIRSRFVKTTKRVAYENTW
jgi:hypothetical protein